MAVTKHDRCGGTDYAVLNNSPNLIDGLIDGASDVNKYFS